jgi:hypothetical protein
MSKTARRVSRVLITTIATLCAHAAVAGPKHSVVELYTSQGCSSCPPADAIAGRLTTDADVLVLSFHVNYWDELGWKDSFSSQASTDRQYAYARSLGERSVFTPQLIVNGTRSVVGSQEGAVQHALTASEQERFPVQANLEKQADGSFQLMLAGPALRGDVWEVRYVRHALTRIGGGENGGRSLETFNNVTRIRRLGAFNPGTLKLDTLTGADDGIAVLVQAPESGKILGVADY